MAKCSYQIFPGYYCLAFLLLVILITVIKIRVWHTNDTIPCIGYTSIRAGVDNCKYTYIIQKLFKCTSSGSRHSTDERGLNKVFALRKQFFQSKLGFWLVNKTFFVHVAGTKGKGSICEYIRLGCMELRHNNSCQFKVGVFTSPHMHTARERIKINSSLISKHVMSTCISIRFGFYRV